MDFINARRFLEEEYQEYLKDPEAYCGFPDPVGSVFDGLDSNNDRPF